MEDKKTCLVLSLTLLQRSVAVEIDRSWIAPADVLALLQGALICALGAENHSGPF